jgi:DNA-binding protein HU-beta
LSEINGFCGKSRYYLQVSSSNLLAAFFSRAGFESGRHGGGGDDWATLQPRKSGVMSVVSCRVVSYQRKEISTMRGKSLTKSEIAALLAEKVGITKKQVALLLEAQADLAYQQAKNVFTLPGLGKLKLVDQSPRRVVSQFGAEKGKEYMTPKRKKVKFTISKAAKAAILGE